MATKKRAAPKILLSIAALCQHALEGVDGLMSGIRFLDRLRIAVAVDRKPEDRVEVSLWMLVAFKSTIDLTGEHVLGLVLRTPKRKRVVFDKHVMEFPQPARSFNIRLRLNLKLKSEGQFWIDVALDGKRYTSVPLHISFEPSLTTVHAP